MNRSARIAGKVLLRRNVNNESRVLSLNDVGEFVVIACDIPTRAIMVRKVADKLCEALRVFFY